jgi:hypothetical protein
VPDCQSLIAAASAGTEVHILSSAEDAITQISNTLMGRSGIESLHIFSHGEMGGLDFGSGSLNLADLPQYAAQLQSWHRALTDHADILLYGCDVAEGELGKAFVQILSQLTGADVAASTNLTGNSAKGGDWNLEFHTGSIESGLAFTNPYSYSGILATVTVTNTLDVVNGDVSSISALIDNSGNDGISLREAIQAANNTAGADTITFGGATFTDATPDTITLGSGLTITSDLTIQGTGASNLAVAGNNSFDLFTVITDVTASFDGLTIRNGNYGIVNRGTISLNNSTISNNASDGILNNRGTFNNGTLIDHGTISLNNSTISNNGYGSNDGYGIVNRGTITNLSNSTISNNRSGLFNNGGIDNLSNSTISNNGNKNDVNSGYGLINYGRIASLSNSTIAGNSNIGIVNASFGNATISSARNNLFVGNGADGTRNVGPTLTPDATNRTGTFAELGVDPTLRDNGGSTQTHALLPGSGAINAATDGTSKDQRGIAAVGTRDIGAFEYLPPTVSLSTSTTSPISKGNSGSFTISRSTTTTGALTVNLTIAGSSTVASDDYTLNVGGTPITVSNGTLSVVIPDGQTSVTLNMQALVETLDIAETLTLTLATGTDYIAAATNNSATITIGGNKFVVNSTADSGEGTLRQAILDANAFAGANTITFAGATFTDATPDTITLSSGLTITDNLTIQGTGATNLAVAGNDNFDLFTVNAGVTASFDDLTIRNGNSGIYNNGTIAGLSNSTLSNNGYGIFNNGTGTIDSLSNSTLSNNQYGIHNNGTITSLNNSTISNNEFSGIYNNGTIDSLSNSTISNNAGYGIYNYNGTIDSLSNSTISNNAGYGIYNIFSTITSLSNSTIAGNRNTGVVSIVGRNRGTISAQNSLFVGNGADGTDNVSGFTPDATNRTGTFAELGVDPSLTS